MLQDLSLLVKSFETPADCKDIMFFISHGKVVKIEDPTPEEKRLCDAQVIYCPSRAFVDVAFGTGRLLRFPVDDFFVDG